MRRMLAVFLVVSAGCPTQEEGTGSGDTEPGTGTSSTGMSGSSASTSSTATTETSTTEPATSSESGEPGSTTDSAEGGSSTSGSAEIECEWLADASGEREWGRCTPASLWQDAEDYCVSAGGHLASIGSASDGIFAGNVLTGVDEAWIGLNDLGGERMYEWTDGTPYEHMNWDDTQPDNPEHRCVGIGPSRRWFDYDCEEHRVFLCARPTR